MKKILTILLLGVFLVPSFNLYASDDNNYNSNHYTVSGYWNEETW